MVIILFHATFLNGLHDYLYLICNDFYYNIYDYNIMYNPEPFTLHSIEKSTKTWDFMFDFINVTVFCKYILGACVHIVVLFSEWYRLCYVVSNEEPKSAVCSVFSLRAQAFIPTLASILLVLF